jgi:cysteine desulfurase
MKYFDFAATTPLDIDAGNIYIQAASEFFGNPSSLHDFGGQSSSLLENCRKELASLIGVEPNGLYFTSGGTESNFLAIEALLSARKKTGMHIISGIAEHSSIHGILKRLVQHGCDITLLPLNSSGLIDTTLLESSIRPETVLVTIQHVNSEIGTIQPIEEIAKICLEHDIYFHSDFVQSFGKINLDHVVPYVSSFSFSSHKFYGPKGVGGIYINPRIHFKPFFPDTTHEKGLRPGTVNVPGAAAMTVAAQKMVSRLDKDYLKFAELRQALLDSLKPICERVIVYQAFDRSQLPNIIGMRIKGIEGQWMMLECNRMGYAISTGSACQVGMQEPAKVTQALGLNKNEAKEFFRISLGNSTTVEDCLSLGLHLVNIVKEQTASSNF